MTIGILETGLPPMALRAEWGTYSDMMRTMLGRGREYRVYDVMAGALPADPAECSAYIITGSSAGVYDDLPWIPPFLDALRRIRGHAKLIGICFGHQAMAKAFGGEVVKSPKGWGVGMHRYEIIEPPPGMVEPVGFAIPAFHQDQVATPATRRARAGRQRLHAVCLPGLRRRHPLHPGPSGVHPGLRRRADPRPPGRLWRPGQARFALAGATG